MFRLLTLALAAPLFILYWWLNRRRVADRKVNIPSWSTLPIFGNALRFVGGPNVVLHRLQEIGDKAEESNSLFELWFGNQLAVVSHKPEDIKAITNFYLEKPYYYNFGREWLGDGLVSAPVSIWKRNIKILTPTFAGTVIDGYQDTYNYQALKLVNKLKSEAGKPPFDAMKKYLAYSTLETICQTAMGVTNISDSVITSEYYTAFNHTMRLMVERGFNLFLHPDWIYRMTPSHRQFKKHVDVLHNLSKACIDRKKRELSENKKKGLVPDVNGTKTKFRPFLDIILELGELDPLLTDEQILWEVNTIILGGQETTATALMFSLLMLGCHKDVQEKLFKEVKQVFGDKRSIEKEDLAKLKYCEAVIYESLRMYPPIPCVLRYADAELKLDDYTIPAGTVCVINMLGSGRSRRSWGPDADQFRPERWLETSTAAQHPAAFLTFSYGRRACIGKKYATALMKTTLAHCVREMVFHSQPANMELGYGIALRPISNHLIQVQLRK